MVNAANTFMIIKIVVMFILKYLFQIYGQQKTAG